jgi:hypothetical protein
MHHASGHPIVGSTTLCFLVVVMHHKSGCHWKIIQAYLGYYVASILRFFTPGPIQGISCRGGYYLAVRCLLLNITNGYFNLRE